MVGEDPNGDRGDGRNRVYGRGKSGEGERGKVFVARRPRGLYSVHRPINLRFRSRRAPSLTYSTLFVGLTLASVIVITTTPSHHLISQGFYPRHSFPVTHGRTYGTRTIF